MDLSSYVVGGEEDDWNNALKGQSTINSVSIKSNAIKNPKTPNDKKRKDLEELSGSKKKKKSKDRKK